MSSQWRMLEMLIQQQKIQDHCLKKIFTARKGFSVSMRNKYATWIESQPWDSIHKSEDVMQIGKMKYDELVQFMKTDVLEMSDVIDRLRLGSEMETFISMYECQPEQFVYMMDSILRNELMLIQSTQENMTDDRREQTNVAQENSKLADDTARLRAEINNAETMLKMLEATQEKEITSVTELNAKITDYQLKNGTESEDFKKAKKQSLDKSLHVFNKRQDTLKIMESVTSNLYHVLDDAWGELEIWKQTQWFACTMTVKHQDGIMEVLDNLFEDIASMFVTVLSQVERIGIIWAGVNFGLSEKDSSEHVKNMSIIINAKFSEHLQRVFIVDKNVPKQVLKVTNGKSLGVSMSARLLGGYALGLMANRPTGFVQLYPEKMLDGIMNQPDNLKLGSPYCTIRNSKDKAFQFVRNSNCLVSFDHMVVSGIKREGRGRNDDFVTDYKHAFIFFTTVHIQKREFHLKARSLPIVITSQTSQECMARGTIIWGAAFHKEVDRKQPFDSLEEVPWVDFAKVMNAMFREYTKRELTEDNIHFLAKKAFRKPDNLTYNSLYIQQKAILKDRMPGTDFPFWKWFMCCLNSVKHHLHAEWKDGLIAGFISKGQAQAELMKYDPGTFLIRFSESLIELAQCADLHGHLTVAVADLHPDTAQKTVFHIKESLSPKDLTDKSLAAILKAYQTKNYFSGIEGGQMKRLLTTLYTPNKLYDFDEAFEKHVVTKDKDKKKDEPYLTGQYVIEIFLTDTNSRHRLSSISSMKDQPFSPAASDISFPASPPPLLQNNMYGGLNMNQVQLPQAPTAQVARIAPNNAVLGQGDMSPLIVDNLQILPSITNMMDGSFDLTTLQQLMPDMMHLSEVTMVEPGPSLPVLVTEQDDGDVMLVTPSVFTQASMSQPYTQ